jgi:putative peptidoglycan lipid II flippase
MVFPTAAQGVSMGVEALNNTICSVLGSGNVTALRLANRIVDSLAGLLPASIVLAAMPSVSAAFIRNDVDGAKKHLQHGLYLLALVTAPVSIWLIMLNQPFIALMYQRRSFTAADTTLVATLLMFMVPYMFLGRFWGLLELPFFAQQNTWTPLVGAVIMAVVFAGASLPLVGILGIYAVPTGRCISYIVCVAFLSFLLHRQIGRIGFGAVTKQLVKVCLAAVFMGICLYAGRIPVSGIHPAGIIRKSIILGVPTCVGFAGYLVALVMLGLKDFNRIIAKKAPFVARWLDYAALWRSRMRAAISNS